MNIPLHRERGLDPHLMICPRCGGESQSLTVGALRKAELPNGQYAYTNQGQTTKLGIELEKKGVINSRHDLRWEDVEEREKVPDSEPCKNCQAEMEEHKKIVIAGGVYFRCTQCRQEGVIKSNEFTAQVREAHKLTNGEICGVEFEFCKEHGG